MIRGTQIELALEIIETIREPHERVTLQQIAEVCCAIDPDGPIVRHQDIRYLERRALRKLREAGRERSLQGEPKAWRGRIAA